MQVAGLLPTAAASHLVACVAGGCRRGAGDLVWSSVLRLAVTVE